MKKIPVKKFRKFIDKLNDNKSEEYAFRIWLSIYPNMNQENYISFSDFYKKKSKEKSREEIKKDIDEAMKAFEEVDD
ncbi:hypothetical protein [Anaerorhabdus sp.]|uniref:hypothetical protein n=1 Tax=Anaerorhabdus sp. TaxID=1872524 RepID=UPI002FCACB16